MVNYVQELFVMFTIDRLLKVAPYSLVVLGSAGALIYSIRVSLITKYSVSYVCRAVKRQWFEVAWLILITNAAAILLTQLFTSSAASGSFQGCGWFLCRRGLWKWGKLRGTKPVEYQTRLNVRPEAHKRSQLCRSYSSRSCGLCA